MERRLNQGLIHKIKTLDIKKPYVWKLRLSGADFTELEVGINAIYTLEGSRSLTNSDNARITLVYLAEWYKRKYKSGCKNQISEKIDLQELWKNSGLSKELYLYKDENGSNRWLYSIFVLGGLAIEHELSRGDNMKFIKGLCRLYHGEDYSIENLEEKARAISFKESIKRQHSLYEYFKNILCGELPFSEDDLKDDGSKIIKFISLVKSANDEILKVKFRLEWVINFSPEYTNMSRKLKVWLKPEELGGGLHQYLRYDRLHLWGMHNPEEKLRIFVYLRFKQEGKVIEQVTPEKPIITFLNHGVNDFVAFGVEKCAIVRNIPSCRFDTIEIVLKDDEGIEYLVQEFQTSEFIQLWRCESYGDAWSSIRNAQKETAVVYTDRCKILDKGVINDIIQKKFNNKKYGYSEVWNWSYIYDSIGIKDQYGKEFRLYNRIGYDQVTTHLHSNIIHYINGGNIRRYYLNDPEISSVPDIEELPLLFCKDDIIVHHFETKEDIKNASYSENSLIEKIEWKQDNGRYKEWTDNDLPPYGKILLRITVKGKYFQLNAIFLPALNKEMPIVRDYDHTQIVYRGVKGNSLCIQDCIPMDGVPLFPTVPLEYVVDDNTYEVNVYRPTLLKEILFDGKIVKYLDNEEYLDLPYIFKDRVLINDFSINGYQSYNCKNLTNIYTDTFLNISGNENTGWAALAAWHKDIKYAGKLLDEFAPLCINVCFGLSIDNPQWENQDALVWNYDMSETPTICSPHDLPDFGIIFQDLSSNTDLICNYPIQVDDDIWGFDDVEVSIIKCFEVANKYGIYFYLMKPLISLSETEVITSLYMPLLQSRNGILNDNDIKGLLRFAEEFSFNWETYNIHIEN